jgi:predicted permease
LLIGAGLLIHSFVRLLATDVGFHPQHVLTFRVGLSDKSYPEEKKVQFTNDLLARLNALPGARSATGAFPMPFGGGNMELDFSIEEHPVKPSDEPAARASVVEPGFFETLQIPLRHGRFLTAQDNRADAPPVAVINQAMADKYFAQEDPVGKRIRTGFDETADGKSTAWRSIVGVVANVKKLSVSEAAAPEYYVPYAQAPVAAPYFAMRVTGDPATYEHSVAVAVSDIDKGVPVYKVRTMDEGLEVSSAQPRFQTLLLTAFAVVALLLAAIGLYAVLSYMVAQRTHEIGLRMALGAPRGNVLGLVMRRGMNLTLIGLSIGIIGSLLLSRFVANLLYGVQALDPLTYISVAGVLLAVSFIASLVPAARAASLDPMETLRSQ